MGPFWSKMKNTKYVLGKKKKSLLHKSALTFSLGGFRKLVKSKSLFVSLVSLRGQTPKATEPRKNCRILFLVFTYIFPKIYQPAKVFILIFKFSLTVQPTQNTTKLNDDTFFIRNIFMFNRFQQVSYRI